MARRKIPQDAFFYYVGLGPKRSYEEVARHYGVTKRAVVNLAVDEKWQVQTEEMERKAHSAASEKALESLEAMNERHLKVVRIIQGKALEALRQFPLETAIAAVKALEASLRHERLIRGEPSERGGMSLEETIRREYERWLTAGEASAPETEEAPEKAGSG